MNGGLITNHEELPVSSVLEIRDLEKDYRALRPLRINRLELSSGDRVGIVGLDSTAAEVLTNLVVGALLPDRGAVRIFGRDTASIGDSNDWLGTIDRIGIMTDRSVLLDQLTIFQNLAVPFTLNLEPVPDAHHATLTSLATDVDIPADALSLQAGSAPASLRARLRLARAIALEPSLLVLEHATQSMPPEDIPPLARVIDGIVARRRLTLLAVTADAEFASSLRARPLVWQPATGLLRPKSRWFSWRT
jgi:ABC-type transporter Mla maintaining outer membrane lipid asymmetry ATPase subunit MlaF